MNGYNTITFETNGSIGTLTLNRPEVHNAMNRECLDECNQVLDALHTNNEVLVLVIKGAGGSAFSTGADLTEFADFGPIEAEEANRRWLAFFDSIEALPKPVIAQVHGLAPGGGTELSLCCDFVVCSTEAKFWLAEINIGVIPGAGAGVRLTRFLGRLRAKEILMLGEPLSGEEAAQIGLANYCVPAESLENAVAKLAGQLTLKPPLALAAAKRVVNSASEHVMPLALEKQLEEFLQLFSSEDQKEGMKAFLEKREAKFLGR